MRIRLENISWNWKTIFYHHKSPATLKDEDIEKVLVSYKIYFGEKNYKYFIGYLYVYNKVKPLHIMLPKTSAYLKSYNGQTKWTYFLIEDNDLLEKYNTIWDNFITGNKKKNLIASLSITNVFWKLK